MGAAGPPRRGVGAAVLASRSSKRKELERRAAELEPVKKLAFEDITALGMELQDLDEDLAGHELDKGTRADYQRALDAYESAKFSGDYMTKPDEITNVTKILDDGRYAIACVRARVAGSRSRPAGPRASSTRGTAWPSRTSPTPRPAASSATSRLRAGRRAGQGRRRSRHPPGDGRRGAGAVLAGRARLRAVRRRGTSAASARWSGCSWA
jgi:hypothetical protein